jgi:carboxypeptidase C (cathepsin A)
MRATFRNALCLALASALLPASAFAAAPHKGHAHVNPLARYVSPDAVTHHAITLGGRSYAYTARAGTIVLRDSKEKPQATMFYTAFTLDGANRLHRPITFVYNGGPGSATLWLRMGSFGPVRVQVGNGKPTQPPPYNLVANQYSLLDKTDLVFIDIAGSGYGRVLPGGEPKSVFGTDSDMKAFGQFVERYITRFGRWNSPKVLYGESYGTPRTALLVDYLQNEGVGINGIVLQSSILNDWLASPEVYGGAGTDDWQYVFAMPTYAATAWYYHVVPNAPKSLAAFMRQMQAFALGPYRSALQQGSNLPKTQFDAMVAKLHSYTGLSETYIRNSNLRIRPGYFLKEFRRERGESLGFYDARYRAFDLDPAAQQPSTDATDNAITDAFTSANADYLTQVLKYHTGLQYLPGAYAAIQAAGGWSFKHDGQEPLNTAPSLAEAMVVNPRLQVFSANGWYDSITPFAATVYTLHHLGIPPALQKNITYGFYPSGHMIYLNTNALAAYHKALETWYANLAKK